MNYFLKGVLTGNKKFFAIAFYLAVCGVAFLDAFTNVAKGWWFLTTLVLSFTGLLIFLFQKYFKDLSKRKKTAMVEEEAAVFEPIREEEIRKLVKNNPEFVTLCYECKHFDHEARHCSRNMTLDITKQRLKEIRIDRTKYCLYWEENPADKEPT